MRKKLVIMAWAVVAAFAFSGCTSYDEEDATIVAYLRVNDLLEQKIRNTCERDIEKFEANIGLQLWSQLLSIEYIDNDYDIDIVNTFYEDFFVDNKVDLEKLEQTIASELWEYLNANYTDVIPSKAQNINEGRYYTIEELRAKYPDYRDLELEDFRPMELVNSVMRENLFELSFIYYIGVNISSHWLVSQIPKKGGRDTWAKTNGFPPEADVGLSTEKVTRVIPSSLTPKKMRNT